MRLAVCFLSVLLATVFVGLAPQAELIWVANGVLLAYLLLAPRNHWPGYVCAAYIAQFSGGLFVGHHGVASGLLLTLLNLSESLVSAFLLRSRSSQLPDFTNPAYIRRFLAYGVFAGPFILGVTSALVAPLTHPSIPIWSRSMQATEFIQWFAADALGVCVATPACVAIFRTGLHGSLRPMQIWAWMLPVIACAIAAFCQARIPLAFLLYPLLVLVLLRVGLGWAALATLMVAGVASALTVRGYGPFAISASIPSLQSAVLLQVFFASALAVLYSVSLVMERQRAAERRLQDTVALHQLVTENSRDIILIADLGGLPHYISPAVESLTGWKPGETMERGFDDVAHPDDLPRVVATVHSMQGGLESATIEYRIKRRSGGYVWVEGSFRALRDQSTGVCTGFLQVVRDISERKSAEEARQLQRSLIDAIHEVSLDGILVVDENENIVSCNRRFGEVWNLELPGTLPGHLEKKSRLSDKPLMTRALEKLKDPNAFLSRVMDLYAKPDQKDRCEVSLNDGRTLERYSTSLRNKEGQYLGRVWFFRDITAHKLVEQQLAEAYQAVEALAITDALTGLANRRHFDECLSNEWRRALRDCKPLSLLLIDADFFKSFNDTYGHLQGDNCLKQIAESAHNAVSRPGDLAARFGGEEFAIILPNALAAGAAQMAENVCEGLRNRKVPHSANPTGFVTVSVGCATLVPQLGQHAIALVDCADRALYQAKRAGRNRVCSYQPHDADSEMSKNRPDSLAVKSA